MSIPPTVLVDLDGTICDTSGRAHLLDAKPRDWAAYSAACGSDEPIPAVLDVVEALQRSHEIILVTGRGVGARPQTEAWLKDHRIPWDSMWMREAGDNRRNPDLKKGIAEHLQQCGRTIKLAIDDHPGVATVYAELGIPTLLVTRPGADAGILVEVAEGLAGAGSQLPAAMAEALSLARDTFARKNDDYAKDGAWRSNFDAIAAQMSITAAEAADTLIAVKQARLQALNANGREPTNEAVVDTYLDRMVYAIIAYALLLDDA
jgi:hypothetical protein